MVLTKRICPITEFFLILQISPLILMTLMLDLGVKLSGEIICVSLSGVKELKNRLYTYPKRSSRQFPQKRCPHDVCQGSSKMLLQIGHLSLSSSPSTNFVSNFPSTLTTMFYLRKAFSDERSLFRNFAEDLYSFNK